MRPVQLEMAGFASFREPTVVDFAGAEYFALVGPTGSGKSTVIDAITFALYGSVPRWDNQRTVSLALAPTAGRGTVRLVFDVGGARYVAARELRRAASGGVSVRSARLERLRDPSGLGGVEEDTEPLADGGPGVSAAVEELLGLPFGDFTTCVVLPQGDFAEFLHAEPRKRQEKLVRILGLGVYDQIARDANSEAAAQRQRAEVLTEQLGGYADATADAEHAAAERAAALTALVGRVDELVPRIAAASAQERAAESDASRIRAEGVRLAALTAPDGLAGLDERRRAADSAVTELTARTTAAESADTDARELLAAAPARGPLESARRHHAELLALTAERPGVAERHDKARAAYDTATGDAEDARAALDAARQAFEAAATAARTAEDAVRRLAAERDGLRALAVPAGLDALDRRRATATAALESASAALAAAETADSRARAALDAAPARAPLEQARREHAELVSAAADREAAVERRAAAVRAAAAARSAAEQSRHAVDHAESRRDAGLRADLAAALRPGLRVGDPCPVCAQDVATVPEPLPAADLTGAEEALASAARAHDAARRESADADAAERSAGAEVARVAAAVAGLRRGLRRLALDLGLAGDGARHGADEGRSVDAEPDVDAGDDPGRTDQVGRIDGAEHGDGAEHDDRGEHTEGAERTDGLDDAVGPDDTARAAAVERALTGLDGHERAAREADSAVRAARRERESAVAAVEAVRGDVAAAGASLRAARDPLVPFGAPDVPDDDVLAGWSALVGWAAGQAEEREAALSAAQAAVVGAGSDRQAAEQALRRAERAAADRRRDETAAARAEEEARGAVRTVEARLEQLQTALRGAPTDATAAEELARVTALESAARTADADLRAARSALRSAERAAAEIGREGAAAWEALRHARDPLVPLGAPAVLGDDLRAAWATLVDWAEAEVGERRAQSTAAEAAVRAAAADRAAAERTLVDDLAAHDLPAAAPAAAPSAVAAARERALAAGERIAERRGTAARLLADRDTAESAQEVARMLGGLLRSDGFPRWLVASALDALVADASTSLAELSGGQFALTHDHGEFLVIDHADADARRPVKTLSGGETFQASLALALALSAQMSALAARGAARLESIFLDEGFGTLDEANLEIVAGTLENLAARGDRMVGVVTHVPALAERVPVRFAVSRDQRTSSVVRENL